MHAPQVPPLLEPELEPLLEPLLLPLSSSPPLLLPELLLPLLLVLLPELLPELLPPSCVPGAPLSPKSKPLEASPDPQAENRPTARRPAASDATDETFMRTSSFLVPGSGNPHGCHPQFLPCLRRAVLHHSHAKRE